MDVSEDGKFILSTCKTYLLIINTEAEADGKVVSGFQKSMGGNKVRIFVPWSDPCYTDT